MKKISILDLSIIIIIIQVVFAGLYRYEIFTSIFITLIPLIILTLFITIFALVVYIQFKIMHRGKPSKVKRGTNKRNNLGSS